ncbi:hypothetical protein C0Q70_01699 [Pomacea canaliculata]|uniref:Uncharacterized protein n=1 Tax=Pomacea canaliculata TaxID=400727 RepID=A0A2T7Q078_POMCA|nr:hypothetical protein C0Q70_01699 [Pomacea canaliculata]
MTLEQELSTVPVSTVSTAPPSGISPTPLPGISMTVSEISTSRVEASPVSSSGHSASLTVPQTSPTKSGVQPTTTTSTTSKAAASSDTHGPSSGLSPGGKVALGRIFFPDAQHVVCVFGLAGGSS